MRKLAAIVVAASLVTSSAFAETSLAPLPAGHPAGVKQAALLGPNLFLVLIGIPLFFGGHIALGIWIAYRVIRGWLALKDKRPMYV